jgi:hypothetical protein
MKKPVLAFFFILTVLAGCKKDEYVANRFAGVYEITKINRETRDSLGNINKETLNCGYTFFLEAPKNPGFGNGVCRFDTLGQQPAFLNALKLTSFSAAARFSCEWNMGPGDNVRLSFVKADPSNIGENSDVVNVKRNALGKVTAWTHIKTIGSGAYVLEEYEIK